MNNKILLKSISFGLVATLVVCQFPSFAFADTESVTYDKTQVVYAKLDSSGKQAGIYVINQFESTSNSQMQVTDYGDYTSIKNISDEQSISAKGEKDLTLKGDSPYLYQGNLSSDTELPWNITVSYALDGNDIDASDLAGRSGDLKMTFDVSANDNCARDYANNYLLQASVNLDNEKCSEITCEEATIAQDSGNTKLSFMIFPGNNIHYEISAKVSDFEFDGFTIAGIPLSISLDVDESEFGDETAQFDDLESAINKINDGAQSLKNATSSLEGGISNLYTGQSRLNDGLKSLNSATSELASGAKQINEALQTLVVLGEKVSSGVDLYSDSLQVKADELKSQSEGVDVANATTVYKTAMSEYVSAFATAFARAYAETGSQEQAQNIATQNTASQYANLENALTTLVTAQATKSSLSSSSDALAEALSGFSDLKVGISSYLAAISQLAKATGALNEGAGIFESSVNQLASGSEELTTGTRSLASGGAKLDDGANELAVGTETLASSTSGMSDKLIESVKDKLTEYLNPEFVLEDFVSGKTDNLSSVQFVYKTESITKDKESFEADASQDNRTFIQKFLALFGIE